ncbi:MAG: hypothetical protein II880_05475, partial [Schwartzia sp.]|nr:hypothetical protein [Schwartzia sp. (in: firmicutes)]
MLKKKLAAAVLAAFSLYAAPVSFPSAAPVLPSAVCESAPSYIDESLRPIQPTVTICDCVDTDGAGVELLRTRWNGVAVGAQPGEFSALRDALRHYNEETAWRAVDTRKNMTGTATAFRDDMRKAGAPFYPLRSETDVFIRRADTLAFSFLESTWHDGGYGGSAYFIGAKTYNARTGKALSLSDVFADLGELAGAIDTQLRRDYPDAPFMADGGLAVMAAVD